MYTAWLTLYLMKTNKDKDQTNQDRRPNKKVKLDINYICNFEFEF